MMENQIIGLELQSMVKFSLELINILIVVVRIFGVTKIGVGGLISTYKTTAQLVLEESEIIEKTIDIDFIISFDYKNMNKVIPAIKKKIV